MIATTYNSFFGDNANYEPNPTARWVLLEMPKKTKSGLHIQESVNKDSSEFRKVYKVGPQCMEVKPGDSVLVSMINRPDIVEGPNGTTYFMVAEHDCRVIYRKPTQEQNLFTSTITKE